VKEMIMKEFYKGDMEQPSAHTVGELIEHLKRLPSNLRIEAGFGKGCELVVYNINHDPFLEIIEID
jgi:hypothetical protein